MRFHHWPALPKRVDTSISYEAGMFSRLIWTVVGAFVGAFLGAGTGIVGAFGGVPGLIVFAVIGGVIGFLATPDINRIRKRFGKTRRKDKN
jgi:outer membrane lipoprotein SlyB